MSDRVLDDVARILTEMASREPAELRGYLVPVTAERAMLRGTSAPVLLARFAPMPSGLLVPDVHALAAAPIDAMYHYVTAEQVLGAVPDATEVGEHLRRVALPVVLMKLATIMSALHEPGADRREVNARFARELSEPYRTRALNLLRDPSAAFIAPQVWFVLAKLACMVGGDELLPTTKEGDLHYAALVAAQHLGANFDTTEPVMGAEPGPFSRELVANQVFNSNLSEAHLFGRFARRWLQLPDELSEDNRVLPLRAVFEEVTGVPLVDFMMLGVGLWAATAQQTPRILPGYFDSLGLSRERQEAALALVSLDIPSFRAAVQAEVREFGLEWAVSTFSQFPVVRLYDGSHLVLDPDLLLRRVFGWLPVFDMTSVLDAGDKASRKRAGQIRRCMQHLSEVYAHEVLASAVAGGPATRLYDGDDLLRAYQKKGRRHADAAVDYGDGWIVVETTTSQVRRDTVAGLDEAALVTDLDKLVDEVEQVDSTIRFLRENEQALTGQKPVEGRRFTPVLVVAEGFPVNPMSLAHLRKRTAAKGLLAAPDTDPLEVLDVEELEMVEALQGAGGPNLRDLLRAKQDSNFHHDSLRNYIIFQVNDQLRRPQRLDGLWEQVFKPTLERLVAHEAA
jgi:hypothetical protein